MMVKVIIVNLANGKIKDETEVNWNRPRSRQWLDKQIAWCFRNGHGVQLLNADDKEPGNG